MYVPECLAIEAFEELCSFFSLEIFHTFSFPLND